MNVAYNSDCLEAMRQMPDKAFDLAVVDPPYGIGVFTMNYIKDTGALRKQYGHMCAKRRDYQNKNAEWDIKPPKEYFDQLFRVSKKQIIFGANYFADMLPPSKGFICWDKRTQDEMTNNFADAELAWISPGMGVARICRYLWSGMLQDKKGTKEDRFHPTQKPIGLYKWIFEHYAKPGYKILDTHLGSGSSRIAAYDAGLDFVGYEIDPEYFRMEEQRFADYTAQMSLFVEGS